MSPNKKRRDSPESSDSSSSDSDSSSSSSDSSPQQTHHSKHRKSIKKGKKNHSPESEEESRKKMSHKSKSGKKRASSQSESEEERRAPKKGKTSNRSEPKPDGFKEETHRQHKQSVVSSQVKEDKHSTGKDDTSKSRREDRHPKDEKYDSRQEKNRFSRQDSRGGGGDKRHDERSYHHSSSGRHEDQTYNDRNEHRGDRYERNDYDGRRDDRHYRNHREDERSYQNRDRDRENKDRGRNNTNRDNHRRRRSRSRSFDHANAKWGRDGDDRKSNNKKESTGEKQKPNFALSGKLTEETNTFKGVVIKYSEPPEARKPRRRWRLYPFKGEKALQTLYIHRESAYLIGRERKVVDLPVDHPSCSKQHAALQYRLVPFTREDGSVGKRVRPYLIDLDSANGTYINNKKIESRKYVELLEKDVIKFGYSSREYVLLHENSKDEALDDDVKQEEQDPEELPIKEEQE